MGLDTASPYLDVTHLFIVGGKVLSRCLIECEGLGVDDGEDCIPLVEDRLDSISITEDGVVDVPNLLVVVLYLRLYLIVVDERVFLNGRLVRILEGFDFAYSALGRLECLSAPFDDFLCGESPHEFLID